MIYTYPTLRKNNTLPREYPQLPSDPAAPNRPVSFVCVRFCDEFDHNLRQSECVHDLLNQLIVVDNTQNLKFATLGQAITHGIAQAINDLVVVVHEDVLLLPGWHSMLEQALTELEIHDPNWGLAGAVGWIRSKQFRGHWSDPHMYHNTFTDQKFIEVEHLDEQILIFRQSQGLSFDSNLPGIHNIGKDLARQLASSGKKVYAINAPTIHKYANSTGSIITKIIHSPKIMDRNQLTYKADKSCSDEYLADKWALTVDQPHLALGDLDPQQQAILDAPIILLGRGGGGTRLLSQMAQDCGLFVGTSLNKSGDCLDLVHWIYRGILLKFNCPDPELKKRGVPDLLAAARGMLNDANWPSAWGFKLPETILILPEIRKAFPNAKYVHLKRDPVSTVLRRTHMTARLDNHIGRISLAQAYDHFGISRENIISDDDISRMAVTTMHQLALVQDNQRQIDQANWLDLSFEAVIEKPLDALEELSYFVALPVKTRSIADIVSAPRSAIPTGIVTPAVKLRLQTILKQLQTT